MSLTARDAAVGLAALLAFPLAVNLTAVTASGDGRDPDRPLFQRGGSQPPDRTARR